MVKQAQDMFYNQRLTLSQIERQWTFEDISKAFGIFSSKVTNSSELETVLENCPKYGPALIEVLISDDFNVYPIISPNKSTGDLLPEE